MNRSREISVGSRDCVLDPLKIFPLNQSFNLKLDHADVGLELGIELADDLGDEVGVVECLAGSRMVSDRSKNADR